MAAANVGLGRAWLLLAMLLCAAPGAFAAGQREFRIGVYVNGDTHPQNLPASRMMADLAAHGITRAVLLTKQYMQLAPQGLHSLAKQWGIQLFIGNIRAGEGADEANMRMLIDLVNSRPDADAVAGWYADDEVEGAHDPAREPDYEAQLRRFVAMIRRMDPGRKVIVNHDARTAKWGGRFVRAGEDESWCSVFWANHFAEGHLRTTMGAHRAAYGASARPLTFVYGAQSTNKFGAESELPTAGLRGATLADLKAVSTRADITDYVMTAYRLGASGASFFVYDGYYDWTYYTLVDERGRSVEGKMEGLRDAADRIAADRGRPTLELQVASSSPALDIAVVTRPGADPVRRTSVQISYDGGYTWSSVPGFGAKGGKMHFVVPHGPIQRGYWSMVRARCFDGTRTSLWSVWNVYPASAPRPSE
jgi:hypothetical protein